MLAVLNFILTYLLLLATASALHILPSPTRLFLGAVVGAASSFVIFLPELPLPLTLALKMALCLIISAVSFHCVSLRFFLKCNAVYLAVNFLFAGLIFGLRCLFAPQGVRMRNGAIYMDLSFLSLVLTAVVCFVLVSLYNLWERRRDARDETYSMRIFVGERCFTCTALYDSGNKLTDGYFGAPVTVVSYAAIRDFLPYELRPFFSGGIFDIYACDREWSGRIRFIPAESVGAESLLPCFRSDRIEIDGADRVYVTERAPVAVSVKGFKSGAYHAIVGPLMFSDSVKGGKNENQTENFKVEEGAAVSGDIGEGTERAEKSV